MLLMVAAAGVAGTAAAQTPVDAPTFDWTTRVPAGSTVQLADADGDIRVTAATDDQLTVHGERTHIRSGGGAMVFQAVTEGTNVTICAFNHGGRCDATGEHGGHFHLVHVGRTASANLTVALPAGVTLLAHTSDGRIEIQGAGAGVTAESGDGDIHVSGVTGAVHTHTSDGAIRIEDVTGSVYARSADGKVTVVNAAGAVEASTADGDVEVRAAATDSAPHLKAHTGDGTVTIYLPAAFGGDIDARTSDGRIDSEIPLPLTGRLNPKHVHASLGTNGAGRLEIDTSDGNVHLKRL